MLLEIRNLFVEYRRGGKVIPAVRNVSIDLETNQTLGVVGESGCGKSTLALSILRLIAPHEGIIKGSIRFEDKELLSLSDEAMRKIRGDEISIIFQDPFTSLNPVIKIGDQINEAILIHQPKLSNKEAKEKSLNLLDQVKIGDADRIYNSYPHQISGGQRQRAMIAMAISNNPKILIADEPTTALDVTIQKEILDLLKTLQKELQMSIILITHHFGIIAEQTEKLAVFYGGEIAEEGFTKELITNPLHPYTESLLKSLPKSRAGGKQKEFLYTIPGAPPNLSELPSGCIFHPRCPYAQKICKEERPVLRTIGENRKVSCHLAPVKSK